MSLIRTIMGKISDTVARPIRVDSATHTLQTIDYEHHEIHGGSHYFTCNYEDLAINDVLQMTFQMPNTTKWIHWNWKIITESETSWEVYEGGIINNALANAITPFNNDRNSANTSGTVLRYEVHANLAAANTDVNVAAATLLETGISGAGRDAGDHQRNHEIILKQNELYVLRATANTAGYIDFCMHWYEHTNKG